jgi:serine/threonine-protein kinase
MKPVHLLSDRYRLIERLGAGGMSVVWRAYDEVLSRPVAVKMLCSSLAADAASRDLIRSEAQAAGRLSHPNVTGVYDYGEALEPDGARVPFVVMELVEGVALDARLARGPLPWLIAAQVAAEVAAALAAAHARGLVHRDIKPSNVMLTASGVKVVDFGIAAVTGADADSSPVLLGTPGYLAPERLLGSAVTPASDVYALGLLLFRMLTGTLPWQTETVTQMLNAHCYTEPDPLPPVADLPDEVADLCTRSLAKQPADRPTATEAAATLAAAAGIWVSLTREDALSWEADVPPDAQTALIAMPTPPIAAGTDPPARDHRRDRIAALAVGSVVAVAAAGFATWSAFTPKSPQRAVAASEQVQAGGAGKSCEVRYETRQDGGGTFAVDVTVARTAGQAPQGWELRFDFPADQTLTDGTGTVWEQSGRTVTLRGDHPLAPGSSVTASLTGGYQGANPIPTAFSLNGAPCTAMVTGAAHVPAAPAPAAPAPAGPAAGNQGSSNGDSGGNGWRGNDGKKNKKGKGGDGGD